MIPFISDTADKALQATSRTLLILSNARPGVRWYKAMRAS